jgi:hypothetical protein
MPATDQVKRSDGFPFHRFLPEKTQTIQTQNIHQKVKV